MQQQHSFEAFEISFSSEDSSLWLPIQWLLLLLSMQLSSPKLYPSSILCCSVSRSQLVFFAVALYTITTYYNSFCIFIAAGYLCYILGFLFFFCFFFAGYFRFLLLHILFLKCFYSNLTQFLYFLLLFSQIIVQLLLIVLLSHQKSIQLY